MKNSFIKRASEIKDKLKDLNEVSLSQENLDSEQKLVPEKEFKLFFDLQKEIESQGSMDYFLYCKKLWQHFFPDQEAKGQIYQEFESDIIIGLHRIDMKKLIYPHVENYTESLIEKIYPKVRKVILWSTGDCEATGYQIRKIERSKIIRKFISGLQKLIPEKKKST